MKRNSDSLYWQNMQLYTFGVAFNALGLILGDLRAGAVRMSADTCCTHLCAAYTMLLESCCLSSAYHCLLQTADCRLQVQATEAPQLAGFGSGLWLFRLFKGYDWVTVMVVANLAFSGLLVSWVMKFADSILKVCTCISSCRLQELQHACK